MEKGNKNRTRRGGFTLVELLIVIIIIGILSGAMMLVAGSGTDKAEATRIVSDMRTLKSAALMVYAEEGKWPVTVDSIEPYLDKQLDDAVFDLADGPSSTDLWVEYLTVGSLGSGVKDQLEKIAASEKNLFGKKGKTDSDLYKKDSGNLYMKLR